MYTVILAFRSTFSIKYFQHVLGLDLATAGAMNSYVFLAAIFATPAFGWLNDPNSAGRRVHELGLSAANNNEVRQCRSGNRPLLDTQSGD